MTTATEGLWLSEADYPERPQPKDLQEFFGIPPSPVDALDVNIREKRKYWKKKQSKARSSDALKFADAVLQAISEAEDALKRGSAASGGGADEMGGSSTGRAPSTVDDVWRELERLLFRGRYGEALERTKDYQERWGTYPAFIDMRSVVILESVQSGSGVTVDAEMLRSAVDGTRQVISQLGANEARYVTLIELLEVSGRGSEIPAAFQEALAALPGASAGFKVKHLGVTMRSQDWTTVLRTAVALVRSADEEDRALRSELVQLLIARAASELLPIDTEAKVVQYRQVVATAAWIAEGVPEAEDFVRVHRMWASNADQNVFGGNWQWRALWGLLTGFLALPLLNSAMSKPAWQVLLEGPPRADEKLSDRKRLSRQRTYFLVTRNMYVEAVHEGIKLPWQARADQWVSIDPDSLFDF